ncbi:hypothetical protein HTG_03035 [Natrinema mahii]|nr:hypothetical protein HTG_03035 [Natrinema mahii]
MSVIAQAVVAEWTETAVRNVIGLALLSGLVATVVAFGYRVASARALPVGVGLFAGLGVALGWLNAVGLGRSTMIGGTPLVHYATAAYVLGTIAASALSAEGGRRVGDRIARDVFAIERLGASGEIAALVRSARLPSVVRLPDRIDDAAGYPPVEPSIKRDLAGGTVLLPQVDTDAALRTRLESRLERDYDLGHVSITVGADGAIDRLAVGRARSGIAATIPPGSVAVSVRGERAPAVGAGDPVEVWATADGSSRLVATGRLWATDGDTATVAVDADAADRLGTEPDARYRLAAQSEAPDDGFRLLAALRAADGTVRSVTVEDGGSLENVFVGWVPGTVLAVVRDGEVRPFPADNLTLRAGDDLSVLATVSELRSLGPDADALDGTDRAADADESASDRRPATRS